MKYLLILLITINCFGESKIHIIPNKSKKKESHIFVDKDSTVEKELLKFAKRSKHFKGVWNKVEADSILSREHFDIQDNSIGFEYFHPINYTIEIEDISEQVAAEKVKSDRKEELREKLKTEDLNPIEINELLRL